MNYSRKNNTEHKIGRRSFLSRGTAAASVIMGGMSSALKAARTEASEGPVVETTSGKIRGVVIDKVNAFKGVPYGASTEATGRFMPPAKPQPWTDIKDTTQIGHRSPQQHGILEPLPEVGSTDRQNPMGEDCLVVNVWTNGLKSGHKRPVMVWLHGGGFASGSGDYSIYDGANMARKRDVVTVTVNHRLNVFGYLYLADIGGAKYADAGNAGHRDIVLALEWVRDDIANFGGDPGNVTIFGQSGGGGKVATLMAMPSAKGLFHRAICQSGSAIKGISRENGTKTAQALLTKLNLKPGQIDQLPSMPFDQVTEAIKGLGPGFGFGPVVDGKTLTHDPFDPGAPEESAAIPLLIGTVEEEINFFTGTPLDPIDDADLHKRVEAIDTRRRRHRGQPDFRLQKGPAQQAQRRDLPDHRFRRHLQQGGSHRGGPQSGAGESAGLQILLHLAIGRARGKAAVLSHARYPVRARMWTKGKR